MRKQTLRIFTVAFPSQPASEHARVHPTQRIVTCLEKNMNVLACCALRYHQIHSITINIHLMLYLKDVTVVIIACTEFPKFSPFKLWLP